MTKIQLKPYIHTLLGKLYHNLSQNNADNKVNADAIIRHDEHRTMKTFLLPLTALAILAGCAEKKYCNTVKIDGDSEALIIEKAANVIPTRNQLSSMENEFIAFVHFGPNTFTQKEWGDGFESADVFALKELDTDQWCEAISAAGMKMVIFTAKHHDGFVMWQSRYTRHGIMSSSFRDGKGDILKDLSESCRKYGLKLGIYLSPADLYQIESPDGLYGNLSQKTLRTIPREAAGRPFTNKTTFQVNADDYNEYYLNQLFELLTEYGPISEVWLDGAHPKRKGGQTYDYHAWKELIHTLAPEATVFGREDIRWCGNEAGRTRVSEWNVIPYMENPDTLSQFFDMMDESLAGREEILKGKWLHYQPTEVNVSIRDGWFYRDDEHQKTRSADDVFDIYERAVGGNAIFLLNIPPNRDGRFSQTDVDVLKETGRRIREVYDNDLLSDATGPRKVLDGNIDTYISLKDGDDFVIRLPERRTLNRIVLQEAVGNVGERAESFAVDALVGGEWTKIATSTNIGCKRILRFEDVTTDGIRFRLLSSRAPAAISTISAHYSHYAPYQGVAFKSPDLLDFDKTAWKSDGNVNILELGDNTRLNGLVYTPHKDNAAGTIRGEVSVSDDRKNWKTLSTFEFGNLVNDPSPRYVHFHNSVTCRYIRITSDEPVASCIDLF